MVNVILFAVFGGLKVFSPFLNGRMVRSVFQTTSMDALSFELMTIKLISLAGGNDCYWVLLLWKQGSRRENLLKNGAEWRKRKFERVLSASYFRVRRNGLPKLFVSTP